MSRRRLLAEGTFKFECPRRYPPYCCFIARFFPILLPRCCALDACSICFARAVPPTFCRRKIEFWGEFWCAVGDDHPSNVESKLIIGVVFETKGEDFFFRTGVTFGLLFALHVFILNLFVGGEGRLSAPICSCFGMLLPFEPPSTTKSNAAWR